MTYETFHRAGLSLSVARMGEGRPLVFQHGLGSDAAQLADVFPERAGWRAITLECRGHGRSDAGSPVDFRIRTFADDLIAFLDASGETPLPLAGISMGAAISLRVAVLRPDLVSALVLARPAWLDGPCPASIEPILRVGQLLRTHAPAEARRIFEDSPMAASLAAEAPDGYASLLGYFDREPADITAELLVRISEDGPGLDRAQIGTIRVPVLVLGNRRDPVHPLTLAHDTAAAIPGATVVEITSKSDDRERHCAEFRSALTTFLQRC